VFEEKVIAPDADLNNSNNSVKDDKEVKSIETYDFECDTELFKSENILKSPVKKSETVKSPESKESKAPVKDSKALEVKDSEALEVKDSKATEVKDSKAPEVKDSKTTEVKDSKAPEVKDSETTEVKDFKTPEVKDSKTTDSKVPEVEKSKASAPPKSPSKSPVKVMNNISPIKTEIKTVVTPVKNKEESKPKLIVKSPVTKELKPESSSIVTVSKPVIVTKQNVQNESKSVGKNIVSVSSPNIVIASSPNKIVASPEKPTIISSNKKPVLEKRIITIEKPANKGAVDNNKTVPIQNTIVLEKPVEVSPKKSEVAQKQVVVSLDTAKKPLIQKKPILVNNDKPVIAGLGLSSKPVVGGVSKISRNIVLSKPVVSIQSSQKNILPPSPVKVGTKIVTIAPPKESSIKPSSGATTHITLANKKKEEKPLTVSLEPKKTTIKPIVKTVEIPKRVSKILGASSATTAIVSSPSKPVVHLADKGIKSPSFEIKLDNKPAGTTIKLDNKSVGSTIRLDNKSAGTSVKLDSQPAASTIKLDKVDGSFLKLDNKPAASPVKLDVKPAGTSVRLDNKPAATSIKLDNKSAATSIKLDNKPAVSAVSEAIKVSDVENKVNGNKSGLNSTAAVGLELVNDLPVGEADGEMIYLLVDDGTDPNLENQTLYIDPSQLAAAAGGLVLQNDAAGGLALQNDAAAGGLVLQNDAAGGLVLQNDAAAGGLVLQNDAAGGLVLQNDAAAGGMVLQNDAAGGLVLQGEGGVPMILQGATSSQSGQILIQNADGALSNLVILDDKESAVVTSADTTGGVATLPAIPSSSLLSQVPLITTSSQQGPIMVSSMAKDEKK